MPKIKVKCQTVQTGECPQTNGRTHTWTLLNVLSPAMRLIKICLYELTYSGNNMLTYFGHNVQTLTGIFFDYCTDNTFYFQLSS